MDGDREELTGGCLCGRVRYRISGATAPTSVAYCHCRMCQRASGAPVMAWATFPAAAIWMAGEAPASFPSSANALRQFCSHCGTQLFFTYTTGEPELDVSLATLDRPEMLSPTYHIWTSSRIAWFETRDSLPRHADDGPDWSPYRDPPATA